MTVPSVEILKDERLLEWRLERFAELSFSAAESSELAESEADWHLAAALASAGSRSRLSSSGPQHRPRAPTTAERRHEPMRTPGPGGIALRGSSA